jgi:hypothetical protein
VPEARTSGRRIGVVHEYCEALYVCGRIVPVNLGRDVLASATVPVEDEARGDAPAGRSALSAENGSTADTADAARIAPAATVMWNGARMILDFNFWRRRPGIAGRGTDPRLKIRLPRTESDSDG